MNELEKIKNKIGKWIEVRDELNGITIEDFDYSTGVIGPMTKKHCAKCVSANKCWFVNEKEKKPEPFPITHIKVIDNVVNEILAGLYHFRCHCQELEILSPNVDDIELVIPVGKIDWLFYDKLDWIRSMEYENNEGFLNVIYNLLKRAYCNGDYKIIEHNQYGVKINLYITIPGAGLKLGHSYSVKSAFMIFPKEKLKCNTILGGRQ